MRYLEDIQQLAIARNADPEKIKEDLLTVASAMGCSIEEAAHALVLALPSYRKEHGLTMYYPKYNDPVAPFRLTPFFDRLWQEQQSHQIQQWTPSIDWLALTQAQESLAQQRPWHNPFGIDWNIRQQPVWELPEEPQD